MPLADNKWLHRMLPTAPLLTCRAEPQLSSVGDLLEEVHKERPPSTMCGGSPLWPLSDFPHRRTTIANTLGCPTRQGYFIVVPSLGTAHATGLTALPTLAAASLAGGAPRALELFPWSARWSCDAALFATFPGGLPGCLRGLRVRLGAGFSWAGDERGASDARPQPSYVRHEPSLLGRQAGRHRSRRLRRRDPCELWSPCLGCGRPSKTLRRNLRHRLRCSPSAPLRRSMR